MINAEVFLANLRSSQAILEQCLNTATLRDDITGANALAVKLRAELGATPADAAANQTWTPPAGISTSDVISDLVEYAATVRTINARALKLNSFIIPGQKHPFEGKSPKELKELFELPVDLTDLPVARDKITATYQDVRNFAPRVSS